MRRGIIAAVLLLASCAGVDAPRWDRTQAPADVQRFEPVRTEFVVEADPDIGNVSFRGVVRSRSPIEVFAPADGRVLDVFFEPNDQVRAGDPVMVFLPALTEAEAIAVEIADLEIALAEASDGSDDQIQAAIDARDALVAGYDSREQIITATGSGLIGPTRRGIVYTVNDGDVLFTLSDASDPVVTVAMTARDIESLTEGAAVTLAQSASTDFLTGRLGELPVVESQAASDVDRRADTAPVSVVVEVDDPSLVGLGDRLLVSLRVQASNDARWVPVEAIGRQENASFVLVGQPDGSLRRLDVRLGRRTESHVQVLAGVQVGMTLVAPQ